MLVTIAHYITLSSAVGISLSPRMKTLITQSNYIPWRGWFALARAVDVVVLYDSAQFTKRDWRNRNLIHSGEKLTWLTIPVETKGRFHQKIFEVQTSDSNWPQSHLSHIRNAARRYHSSPDLVREIEALYQSVSHWTNLSQINRHIISWCFEKLKIDTKLLDDRDFEISGNPSERLARIAHEVGAATYVTGTAAREYLDENEFFVRNINIEWVDYSKLPSDPSLPEGAPEVSIIDTLLRCDEACCIQLSTFSE